MLLTLPRLVQACAQRGGGMRYFFYGSLTDPDVLAVVLGRRPRRLAAATLQGWRRLRVAGECYPLIAPAPGERVEGVVADVTAAEARRLAWYEGDDYEVRELDVELASGEAVAAQAFLPKPDLAHADEAWDSARWRRKHKPALLEAAKLWMGFERLRPANADAAWRATRRRAQAR
jgi:hypothetical protein